MINKNIPQQLLAAVFCIYSLTVSAQSICGNVNSEFSNRNLGYASVDIYKKGKLVGNVLTDLNGNFKVNLDTGIYQCVINYAGFEKITKEIRVNKDEKAEFIMPKDAKSKYSAEEVEKYSSAKIEDYGTLYNKLKTAKGVATTNPWGESKISSAATSGKLTSGEINDFSKWNLWADLANGVLKVNQQFWNFSPTDRYVVQLKDQNGLPLANAKVELCAGSRVLYKSRSDNTGKAELWGSLKGDTLSKNKKIATSIRVDYNGETKTISKATPFEKGINTFVFNTKCEQSQNVDIAIVVDATGSMQDEMEYLKFDLNDVIFKSKEFSTTLNLRFANIFYRDLGDEYVTKTQNFTRVLSESVAFTNKHNAGGGGDGPEAVEEALDFAINKLSWSADARTKILFLILDASPHNTPEIQEKMRNLSYKAAEKGIRIVSIAGSGSLKDTEYLMRCIALATNGTYTFLTDRSGIGGTHMKPSTDGYEIENLNDMLVRVIKSYTYMPDCQQYVADLGVNLPDSQVVISNPVDSTKLDTTKTSSSKTADHHELNWKFFPNPTNGLIHIISSKKIDELYISDLSGKVLQVIRNIEADVTVAADLSEYAKGIYLIRYPNGKQWISGKIVLN